MAKVAINGGKVVIKGGKVGCSCCCPTTLPEFVYDSIAASKAKQGLPEFGTPSVPPVRYLTEVNTTTDRQIIYAQTIYYVSATGDLFRETHLSIDVSRTTTWTSVVDPDTGAISSSVVDTGDVSGVAGYQHYGSCSNDDWVLFDTFYYGLGVPGHSCTGDGNTVTSSTTTSFSVPDVLGYTSNNSTTSKEETCANGYGYGEQFLLSRTSSSGSCVRSNPYTDEALDAAVRAAMPAYDDDRNDTAGSYRNQSDDHLTLSLRFAKGFLPLSSVAASLVDGRNYNLIYIERFTPLSGAAVDGPEQTFSYTHATANTHAGPLAVPEVAAPDNGTITLHLVRWECPPAA